MGVPTSEVGYTSAMPRREDHEVRKGHVGHWIKNKDHTQRRNTVGRTPLDTWSVRRRDLYLTTHNTHSRPTSMPPVRFEPHNLSRRAAVDLCLRPRGHWDRQTSFTTSNFRVLLLLRVLLTHAAIIASLNNKRKPSPSRETTITNNLPSGIIHRPCV